MLDIDLDGISEEVVRENFRKLGDLSGTNPFLKGDWIIREYTFTQAETNKKIPHGLPFTPRDIVLTFCTIGSITIYYELTDATNLNVSTAAACTFRLLIGRF
jgi:hypothetical protein